MSVKQLNHRQARWVTTLASYNFIIQFQPGSPNTKADALSRRGDMAFDTNDPRTKQPILQMVQPGQLVLAPLTNHSVDLDEYYVTALISQQRRTRWRPASLTCSTMLIICRSTSAVVCLRIPYNLNRVSH